ncbi:MAG: hypothetical protein HON90_00440 [Halobacteriovoraceae bacterium]|nr:hypothetical protein [Halobacteriovoraceae bacterium]
MYKLLFVILLVVLNATAAEKVQTQDKDVDKPVTEEVQEPTAKVIDNVVDEPETAPSNDKSFAIFGTYSSLDTWLPGKMGLTASYGDDQRVYELAYQNASYSFDLIIDDLGKISDTRIHLSTRSFTWGGSFNFQYGAYYNSFKAYLGNSYTELLDLKYDYVDMQTMGVMWGLGNRWHWSNGLGFSVDYFKTFWPLLKLGEESDYLDQAEGSSKDDVKELLDTLGKVPTFSILHLEVGYRF